MPKLCVDDFIRHPEVAKRMDALKQKFSGKPLVISDVIDNEGNQYVHLVQKGGGVLGVALVGYTYVLEEMNIRFLKLAGTSAGAINTALMSVIGEKNEKKSSKVLQSICDLEFFSLVDGHPFARWCIRNFITNGDFGKRIRRTLLLSVAAFVLLLISDFILLGLQHHYEQLRFWGGFSFVLTGIVLLLFIAAGIYFKTLLKRLKNAGYGICSGDFFYDWIKKQFTDNGVHTITQLEEKAARAVPGMRLRQPHADGLDGLDGSVTFITSDLSSKNKIQFPAMWDLFRPPAEKDRLHPAGFVRASMSIPVFFESYMITNIPLHEDCIKKAWLKWFGESHPPSSSRFVDGGILSNFPLSLFYNPKVTIPRLPVLGIDLDDSSPGDHGKNAAGWSFAGYISKLFFTVQNHSDKEFLLKNRVYEKGVGKIKVRDYNWLNFFLPDVKKIDLFILGVNAAADFLERFDWEEYKSERAGMHQSIKKS